MNNTNKEFLCPLEYGLDLFKGKWTTRIICMLGSSGTLRYKEIRTGLKGMTDAVLAATLKDMAADGLIERRQFLEIPPRVEYSLTQKGKSAFEILKSICRWVQQFNVVLSDFSHPPCKKR
ncbi:MULTISPECIES: winged helix-turn-helix transcriptional regulator [unclassified Maridesulfovibrio]|uniref:winged helix-turn-helix transcriptional regulator n=1 Tax=unclassified Maridesulfovibrio TaxID=2794999 RepID=UPI003B41C7B1